MRADEIAIETAKPGKMTALVAVMSIFCKNKCKSWSANPGNDKPFRQKAKSPNFPEEISRGLRNLSQKTIKGWSPKNLAPKSKKSELHSTNLELHCKKTYLDCAKTPDPRISYGLKIKSKTIRVLLDSGSSGDLLFMKKQSSKRISVAKQVVPQSWGTSDGTFITDKVGDIEIFFVEYSASKKVRFLARYCRVWPGRPSTNVQPHNRQANIAQPRGSIGLQGKDHTSRQDPLAHEEHCQSATQTQHYQGT
jgi:hypothetical protein